jgi:hypothetical protein
LNGAPAVIPASFMIHFKSAGRPRKKYPISLITR